MLKTLSCFFLGTVVWLSVIVALAQVPGQTPVGIFGSAAANTCGSPVTGMTYWYTARCMNGSFPTCSSQPSDGTTYTSGTMFKDLSGNSHDTTVAAGTFTFHTNRINGQPSITTSGGAYASVGGSLASPNQNTIFVVMKYTGTGAMGMVGRTPSGAQGLAFYVATGDSGAIEWDTAGNAFGGRSTGTISSSTWALATMRQAGPASGSATRSFAINGSDAGLTGGTNQNTDTPNQIFTYSSGTNTFVGEIAEIILYGGLLSAPQLTTNYTYFNCVYGSPL